MVALADMSLSFMEFQVGYNFLLELFKKNFYQAKIHLKFTTLTIFKCTVQWYLSTIIMLQPQHDPSTELLASCKTETPHPLNT